MALGIRRGGEWVGMAAAAAASVVAGTGFRWDGPPAHYVTHFFFGLANWQTIESLMTFKFSVCPGAVAAAFAVYSIKNVHL